MIGSKNKTLPPWQDTWDAARDASCSNTFQHTSGKSIEHPGKILTDLGSYASRIQGAPNENENIPKAWLSNLILILIVKSV